MRNEELKMDPNFEKWLNENPVQSEETPMELIPEIDAVIQDPEEIKIELDPEVVAEIQKKRENESFPDLTSEFKKLHQQVRQGKLNAKMAVEKFLPQLADEIAGMQEDSSVLADLKFHALSQAELLFSDGLDGKNFSHEPSEAVSKLKTLMQKRLSQLGGGSSQEQSEKPDLPERATSDLPDLRQVGNDNDALVNALRQYAEKVLPGSDPKNIQSLVDQNIGLAKTLLRNPVQKSPEISSVIIQNMNRIATNMKRKPDRAA